MKKLYMSLSVTFFIEIICEYKLVLVDFLYDLYIYSYLFRVCRFDS